MFDPVFNLGFPPNDYSITCGGQAKWLECYKRGVPPMISVYQMAEITSAMIPSNSSSVKSSSISKRMPWGKNCYGIFVTPMIIVKECNNVNGDEDGKKLAWYFIFWDHPKCVTSDEPLPICVKKPAIKSTSWPSKDTTQELLNWFKSWPHP